MVDDQLHPFLLLEVFIANFTPPALEKDTSFVWVVVDIFIEDLSFECGYTAVELFELACERVIIQVLARFPVK
jgi:hypothetical protein